MGPKHYPIVVRRITQISGDSDQTINIGNEGEVLNLANGSLSAQSVGSEGESLAIALANAGVSLGSEGESASYRETGSGTMSSGTEGESIAASSSGAIPASAGSEGESMAFTGKLTETAGTEGETQTVTTLSLSVAEGSEGESFAISARNISVTEGSEGESFSANSSVLGTGYTVTAVNVRNAGTHDWSPTANATGAFNDTSCSISAAASTLAGDSYNNDLKCSAFPLANTPSGWTRSKVELLIRHSWDLSVGLLSSASITVTLRNSADTILTTPINRAENSGDQATLLTETFDVTSAVASLTDAQLQATKVWCTAVCNLLLLTGGNASWNVDGVHIRITYTRTGIT